MIDKAIKVGDSLIVMYALIILAIILYYGSQFSKMILTLKQNIIFPLTGEEQASIRRFPQKPIKSPTLKEQKGGLIGYVSVLLFVIAMFIFTWVYHSEPMIFTGYILIMLPLINIGNILNVFAITKNGVLLGARFIKWETIKRYELQTIDIKHKYYGHAKEVNDQYVLIIHTKLRGHDLIVTSREAKDKLIDLLHEKEIYESELKENESRSL